MSGQEAHEKILNITDYYRKTSQNYSEVWPSPKKVTTDNKCWRRCGEKGTLPTLLVGMGMVQPLWRTVWTFLKELKIATTIWSCNPTPGHKSTKKKNKPLWFEKIHVSQCLLQLYLQKPRHRCNLNGYLRWRDKEKCDTYIQWEYYSAINKGWNNVICRHMDRPRDDHTKQSQLDR